MLTKSQNNPIDSSEISGLQLTVDHARFRQLQRVLLHEWRRRTRRRCVGLQKKNKNVRIFRKKLSSSYNSLTSISASGVGGAGDVGSGVFAPLDSARLSVLRFARGLLHGNFMYVWNFLRSSSSARSCFTRMVSSEMSSSSRAGRTISSESDRRVASAGGGAGGAGGVRLLLPLSVLVS